MKIEIPKFDGTDLNGWVLHIEEIFNFHKTPANLWLCIVSSYMEERTLAWYHWMKGNNLLLTWPGFLANLKQQFRTSQYEDHQVALSKLTQTTSVSDF